MTTTGNAGPDREAPTGVLAIDALVDEASMDSFPASDPPSYWARTRTERGLETSAAETVRDDTVENQRS